jgi:hypothetical protein
MLKLIGYWKENEQDFRWIRPKLLVAPQWELKNRRAICEYLRSGICVMDYLGYSFCRFPNGPTNEEMGNSELSDGVWVWPVGLVVYVEKYHVRLPDEFINHMKQYDFKIPTNLKAENIECYPMDIDFWEKWGKEQISRR